ncbi:MAG: diguanylate cyclase [Thermoanaerobaculia bacterium]
MPPTSPIARRLLLYFAPVLLLAGLFFLKATHADESSARRVGFSLRDSSTGVRLWAVVPGLPADRAGFKTGDRLIQIADQPIVAEVDYDRAAVQFRRGAPTRTVVDRDGERLELELHPGVPLSWRNLLLDLFVAAAYLFVGFVAIGQAGRDLRARLLYFYSLAVATELLLPAEPLNLLLIGVSSSVAFYLLSGLQMGLEIHLATLVTDRPKWLERRPWVVALFYTTGGAVALAAALAVLVERRGGRLPWASNQAEFLLIQIGLPVWAATVATVLGERFLHHPRRVGRQQAGLVLLGLLPWMSVVFLTASRQLLGLPVLDIPGSVWTLVLLAFPVAVFVAIFRYRLFDIELVIRKSLLYGALTTSLVLIFYAALGAGSALFAHAVVGGRESVWVVSVATLGLGLLFNPLRTRLQLLIDRKLFPKSAAFRQRILGLSTELAARGKLPRMGEFLCDELCRTFGLGSATLWIAAPPMGQLMTLASSGTALEDLDLTVLLAPDDAGLRALTRSARAMPVAQLERLGGSLAMRLRSIGADLIVPMLSHGRLVGLLLLSAKRDGERFAAEEIEILNLLANQAGTVFENARLFESATFEGLTGLFRREAVLEILDREWSRSIRYERPLSIALADLDRFKWINDRSGHLSGDIVLQRVAAELRAHVRETDFIGRFGGEEFLLVLPETNLEGALRLAEKIRERIEALEIPDEHGTLLRVTVSIGVAGRAEVRGDGVTRARPLLAAADAALYEAKRNGRNRVEAAEPIQSTS